MASNDQLVAHCLELLAPLGAPRARRMFGGHGLYVDDLFVALIAFDRLYLKADAQTKARFEAAGCAPFVYDGKGQSVTMSYFTAPDDAMESPAYMQPWGRLALEAALRAKAAKKPSSRARRPKA
jgi:DNA transformation protein